MTFIVENGSGSNLDIAFLGITLLTGATTNLAGRSDPEDIAEHSQVGEELHTLILAGNLIIKDPIDGVTDLSAADGVVCAQSINDPHYRVGPGARIGDVSDIGLTSPVVDDLLQFNGTTWVNIPASTIGGGGSFQLEWRFSTSLVAADPGNGRFRYNNATLASVTNIYFDDSADSGFDVGTIFSTLSTGDKIYIQQNNDATKAALFTLTGAPTDNIGWWTVPVTVDGSGTLHDNNTKCAAVFFQSGAGGGTINNAIATINADTGVFAATGEDSFNIVGGTGISTSITGDILTITNDSPNVDQNLFLNVLSDSGTAIADTTTDTLSILGGTGISTAVVADALTITNNSPNATHTGQVTGATALALDVTAITAQPASGAVIGTDTLLINDGGVLSEVTITQLDTFFTGAPDQNLWETIVSDLGSAVANITTDSLSILGGAGISTAIVGDVLTIVNDSPNIVQSLWETISSDVGSVAANIATDTLTIAGGTGISTAVLGDTLTITNDSPNIVQNLWETIVSDLGSAVANIATDSLSIVGGTGISTAIVGDVLTITATGGGGGGDLASVLVSNTISVAIPLVYSNVTWNTTRLENDAAVIEHDNINTARILIKETGLYFINFNMSFDADALEEQISARVMINDITEVPGSERIVSEDDEINDLSNAFTAELTAGTFLTFQHLAAGTGNLNHFSSNFSVTRARGSAGADGAQGIPGSGTTLTLEEGGVAVTNTPHNTLDFAAADFDVTDNGDGSATVTLTAIFGSEFQIAESAGISTTTSQTFQNKVSMTTTSLPAGTYRVQFSYGWNHNNNQSDFEGQLEEDALQLGELHKQEPKDNGGADATGSTQRYYASRTFYRTLTAGVHTYDVNFRTDDSDFESSIWEAVIELWRVS